MLRANHGTGRRLAGLMLAGAVSAAGVALAVPAAAHEEGQEKQIYKEKVIIHGDHQKRTLEDVDKVERLANTCDGEKVEVSADGGGSNKKQAVKVVICVDKGEGPTALADALSKTLSEMDSEDRNLDPKIKAELKAKIEAKLRGLRAKG